MRQSGDPFIVCRTCGGEMRGFVCSNYCLSSRKRLRDAAIKLGITNAENMPFNELGAVIHENLSCSVVDWNGNKMRCLDLSTETE